MQSDTTDLRAFGWAPGWYEGFPCADCKQRAQMCAKRSWRCEACARAAKAEADRSAAEETAMARSAAAEIERLRAALRDAVPLDWLARVVNLLHTMAGEGISMEDCADPADLMIEISERMGFGETADSWSDVTVWLNGEAARVGKPPATP
jgi:hypothetical protein